LTDREARQGRSPSPTAIDVSYLCDVFGVADLADDPKVVALVERFVADLARRVDELGDAAIRGDQEVVVRGVHDIAGYFGAHRLAELCRAVEEAGVDAPVTATSVDAITAEADDVRRALRDAIAGIS